MKLDDIIALAKNGYKPSDIKELITLAIDTPKKEEEQTDNTAEVQKAEKPKEEEPVTKEEPDYKALYEKSQNDLKALQQANVKKDVSNIDIEKNEKLLDELFRSYM